MSSNGVSLVGGRYDGFLFRGTDGFVPGADTGAIYLGRPTPGGGGDPLLTTTGKGIPFSARERHDPFDKTLHGSEVYLRCRDGLYRTPKLAAAVP